LGERQRGGIHLGCFTLPKKVVAEIVASGNHYLIQVKANQPTLYQAIEATIQAQSPQQTSFSQEKGHGRQSEWVVCSYKVTDEALQAIWKNLFMFVVVRRFTLREGKEVEDASYYITDVQKEAKWYQENIRGHWHIENRLHYVKDVVLNEDHNHIQDHNRAVNVAVFNTFAINILRNEGFDSITKGKIFFGADIRKYQHCFRI
jgi:predicted transposase YbfD/YdcC